MKKKKAAKAAKQPATLIATVYALVKAYNFITQHIIGKDDEAVVLYPGNGFAEKIEVRASKHDVGETLIEMHRICGGDKYVSLAFVSNESGRTESAALAIIKAELKRYC